MCVLTHIQTHVYIIYISIISPKINNTILKDQIFKKSVHSSNCFTNVKNSCTVFVWKYS